MKFELNPDRFKHDWETRDDEISNADHDELLIQLLDRKTWRNLITEFRLQGILYSENDVSRYTEQGRQLEIEEVCTEVPVLRKFRRYDYDSDPQIVGYIDLVVHLTFGYERTIACEVKVKEPSFGSVVRQINKYRQYTDYNLWTVVSPYEQWKVPLESQGIIWIPSQRVLEL